MKKAGVLTKMSQILLPDVDEVLDVGHALHGADDVELAGSNQQALAKHIVRRFMQLKAKAGTAEMPYLASVQAQARSYGRALTRRKKQYITEVTAAQERRDLALERIRESRFSNHGLGMLWRFIGPAFLGLSGYLFAQVIGNVVPDVVTDKTGTGIPSVIMSLAFLGVGRYLVLWLYDRKRDRIVQGCHIRCRMALLSYEHGKLYEFKLAREHLCEAWHQYTGQKYPERASYQMVMEADIAMHERLEAHDRLLNRSEMERLGEALNRISKKVFRTRS